MFLSDLHNKIWAEIDVCWMRSAKQRPDLILIGRDMLVGKKGCSFAPALEFVSKLPAIAPVYYACRKSRAADEKTGSLWGRFIRIIKSN